MTQKDFRPDLVRPDDLILITGATGFIGAAVVRNLLDRGFGNLRCLARPSSDVSALTRIARDHPRGAAVEVLQGNLLSADDCARASRDVAVIFHLATGRDGKSFPDAYMNAVVATRNLLEASRQHNRLQRFVNISSFAVYSNVKNPQGRLLDESSPVDPEPHLRGEAYCFAKIKQDDMVIDYGRRFGTPYVIVRPGYVIGPGKSGIVGRVGIGTFGLFLHLGGGNRMPFTYIDNCADAIALAGLIPGIDGEVFNVIDDDLPSSRQFLRQYKRQVKHFPSIYVPHAVSYALCYFWERYSVWSEGQLPLAFNRRAWHAYWKRTRYSNAKLKTRLGWTQKVSTTDGLNRFFQDAREQGRYA